MWVRQKMTRNGRKMNSSYYSFRCNGLYKLPFKISDGWEFVKLRGERQFHIYLLVYSAYIFWFVTDFSKPRHILVSW